MPDRPSGVELPRSASPAGLGRDRGADGVPQSLCVGHLSYDQRAGLHLMTDVGQLLLALLLGALPGGLHHESSSVPGSLSRCSADETSGTGEAAASRLASFLACFSARRSRWRASRLSLANV